MGEYRYYLRTRFQYPRRSHRPRTNHSCLVGTRLWIHAHTPLSFSSWRLIRLLLAFCLSAIQPPYQSYCERRISRMSTCPFVAACVCSSHRLIYLFIVWRANMGRCIIRGCDNENANTAVPVCTYHICTRCHMGTVVAMVLDGGRWCRACLDRTGGQVVRQYKLRPVS